MGIRFLFEGFPICPKRKARETRFKMWPKQRIRRSCASKVVRGGLRDRILDGSSLWHCVAVVGYSPSSTQRGQACGVLAAPRDLGRDGFIEVIEDLS
jgi:hypothetical protein